MKEIIEIAEKLPMGERLFRPVPDNCSRFYDTGITTDEIKTLAAKVKEQAEVIRELREGLEHYADEDNWRSHLCCETTHTKTWYDVPPTPLSSGYDKAAEILDRHKGEK